MGFSKRGVAMRLTHPNPNNDIYKRKLANYEDIEDDIGIDLVTKDRVERAHEIYSKFYDEYIDDFTLHRCGVEINNRYDASGNNHILLYKNYKFFSIFGLIHLVLTLQYYILFQHFQLSYITHFYLQHLQ